MRILITEEQQKKLFIPRKLSDNDSRYSDWNKQQPIKDGKPINQYDPDGRRQGYWEYYFSDGSLDNKGNYKDDERVGIWVTYFDNGNLESKGMYKNGMMDGIWKFYLKSKNGKLTYKRLYGNGWHIEDLPLTESDNKKKLFIPRKIDEREIELKNHLKKILNSEEFQDDLEELIREWWPEISDFDEWLGDNGWGKDYIINDEQLGFEISHYLRIEDLTDFVYDLIDFDRYIDFGGLVLTKLKEMKYL